MDGNGRMDGGLMNGVLMRVVCSPVGLLLYCVCTRDYCLLTSSYSYYCRRVRWGFNEIAFSWIISISILGGLRILYLYTTINNHKLEEEGLSTNFWDSHECALGWTGGIVSFPLILLFAASGDNSAIHLWGDEINI